MKKKILITQRDLSVGGIQSVLINLLYNLDYTKVQVDLILLRRNEGDKFLPPDVNIFYMQTSGVSLLKKILYPSFLYYKEIKKRIKKSKEQYDIAIAFNGYDDTTDYIALSSNSTKKIIFIHGNYETRLLDDFKFKLLWRNNKLKYREADKIIAVSESAQQAFNNLLPEYVDKTTYIFNYLPDKKKEIRVMEDEIEKDSRKKILLIGRMIKSKGFIRIIDICMKLKDKNILFIIIGDGPERKNLQNKILKNSLEKNIKILGFKKNISEYLKIADLLLITSNYEGFGMTLLESFKEGTPVVAPRIPGIIDIYEHLAPKNAMRISDNSNDELIKNILKELENPQKNKFEFDEREYNRKIDLKYKQIIFTE